MRVIIQRVSESSVSIAGKTVASIGFGMMILVGFTGADTEDDIDWIAGKISRLRIFDDNQGVMNLSVLETGGEVLLISQFTLYARTRKGNRPSYIDAAVPEIAIPLYEKFAAALESIMPGKVSRGVFGADMAVSLVNDGPVTIILDSTDR